MRRTLTTCTLLLASLTTLVSPAVAQTEVERRRPAQPGGTVSIDNDFGSVTVRAWENKEVLVRGVLAAGAEGLSFEGEKGETRIAVEVPEAWFHAAGEDAAFRSNLEVFVPAAARVSVETVNAPVAVVGVRGQIEVESVNGAVRIDSPSSAVEVETMTGAIEVRAKAAPMSIQSISGAVLLEGVAGEVQVETVSGNVTVKGSEIAVLDVETTTGRVEVQGALVARGEIDIETFSGPVRLVLPVTVKARFDLQTFAGQIRSQVCAGTPLSRRGFEPFRRLQCSTGGAYEISVRTHDASITIVTEGNK